MGTLGLNCASSFAKYVLFVFNVIFWIIGASVLGVGIWVLTDKDALQLVHVATVDSSDGLVQGAAITLVVVGVIVFITGFLGCCGAIRESPSMLLMYAVIVVFIVILQIVAGILGALFRGQIGEDLQNSMALTVKTRYGNPNNTGMTEAWNFMQREFGCCGAQHGPVEWQTAGNYWYNHVVNKENPVPLTCCVLTNPGAINDKPDPVNKTLCYQYAEDQNNTLADQYVHIQGCKPKLEDWVKDHADLLTGLAIGLAVVQVLGIILACCLRRNIKSLYEYV